MRAVELLLLFGDSVLWYPGATRLMSNGFKPRETAAVQVLSREESDKEDSKARKETMRHAVLHAA